MWKLTLIPLIAMVVASIATTGAGGQQDEFLSAHNEERASVGVIGLVWNDTVAAYAQNYSELLRDQADCALEHSHGPFGENLYWSGSASASATEAVKAWISEKQYYDYDTNTCAADQTCGDYTQVVWANSLRLGCALIACNDYGGTFVICNYDPPGNSEGERPY